VAAADNRRQPPAIVKLKLKYLTVPESNEFCIYGTMTMNRIINNMTILYGHIDNMACFESFHRLSDTQDDGNVTMGPDQSTAKDLKINLSSWVLL
jgi:hypothetical protein